MARKIIQLAALLSLLTTTPTTTALSTEDLGNSSSSADGCSKEAPSFRIVGTRSIQTLSEAWRGAYLNATKTDSECDGLEVNIEGFSWPVGAARVCGNHPIYSDADIAGMSGPFFHPQASTENGWSFDCKFGSKRETILVRKRYKTNNRGSHIFLNILSLCLSAD